jgi:4-hydroxy-3-polyprenylbenzoate decarboxylase
MTQDFRGFLDVLEQRGQLRRIKTLVDSDLEIAEIANRMLQCGGPGLLFENVIGAKYPVAVNIMGTVERICWAMNMEKPQELEDLGRKLAMLQQPKPPKKVAQAIDFGKVLFDVLKAKPSRDYFPPCQQVVIQGDELDLNSLPLIRPYAGDAGKIVTLGLVITKDCETGTPNIGVHPLVIMAAATPIPMDLSEWLFAGIYGGGGVKLAKCKTVDLEVPADSEFVLEGTITPGEELTDGPFGDHMGYYNLSKSCPLIRFNCMTHRKDPVYLTTFSGRPPKEEAMMAIALNRIYTPILRQQVPEIVDFFLPMEALSYKAAVISIDKAYPGQARRAALAFWSALPQFTYTKFVIIVDKDINIRDPRQVVWAISSKVDPQRDVFIIPDTPFDKLDFATPKVGLGSRMGIDATTKVYPETDHVWGEQLESDPNVAAMVSRRWKEYGLGDINLNEVNANLFGYDM